MIGPVARQDVRAGVDEETVLGFWMNGRTKMTTLPEDLNRLYDRIVDTDEGRRYLFQPQLSEMIERMETAGQPVPARIRDLHEDLTADAIEAQFDNMPV